MMDFVGLKSVKVKKILYAVGFIMILLFVYKCPMRMVFGIPCAGCGLSRAMLSFFSGDVEQAIEYHPLFFLAGVELFYLIFRKRIKLDSKTELAILIVTVILFTVTYIYRLKNNLLV